MEKTKALVLGFSKNKVQVLYAGDIPEAKIYFGGYKPRVAITRIELWDKSKGVIKRRDVTPPTNKRNAGDVN